MGMKIRSVVMSQIYMRYFPLAEIPNRCPKSNRIERQTRQRIQWQPFITGMPYVEFETCARLHSRIPALEDEVDAVEVLTLGSFDNEPQRTRLDSGAQFFRAFAHDGVREDLIRLLSPSGQDIVETALIHNLRHQQAVVPKNHRLGGIPDPFRGNGSRFGERDILAHGTDSFQILSLPESMPEVTIK